MKKYILLLSALIISAAVFCGCDENVPTETSRFSSKSYSSAQSSAESSDEDAQSSGESAEAADSSKASEKSKPESAQPSKTDGSKEEKKNKDIPVGSIRTSQLITTFGSGAIADMPDYSVIISGIEKWDVKKSVW